MQQKLLNMMGTTRKYESVKASHLSFKPFLDYVRGRLAEEGPLKRQLLQYIADQFAAYPELQGNVDPATLSDKQELLDLLYASLSNITDDEKTFYWGLATPMTPVVFYGTTPFYELLNEANLQVMQCQFSDMDEEEFIEKKMQHFYAIILHRFYGIDFKSPEGTLVRNVMDPATGLVRHYRVDVDTRFVDIQSSSPLPVMNIELLRAKMMDKDPLHSLKDLFPLEQFSFSGFSIITIVDVTAQSSIDSIRNRIVNGTELHSAEGFPEVVQSLKELVANGDVGFNIIPFYRVNGKLVEDISSYSHSVLFEAGSRATCSMTDCRSVIEIFINDPRIIYYGDLDIEMPRIKEVNDLFRGANVKSYSLLPMYYNGALVGALEIYSYKKGLVDEKIFGKLEPAKNLIAQLIQNSLTAFSAQIESVIKEKFTTLQPPVQWKFNEVAWKYIEKKRQAGGSVEPADIVFENVYPLYGAVDIRNSTIERNAALAEDLKVQFTVLIDVLMGLKKKTGFGLLEEKIFSAQSWLKKIENSAVFSDEIRLNDFLENEMMPFLTEFVKGNAELVKITKPYFDSINEADGIAQENRRELEKSMTTVISAVNNYFDMLRGEIQQAYPSYFDKFRTDGVEYDIYIGQSITPDRPYSDIYLKNLRLLQLSSMAAISRYTHSLQPLLTRPVETTQLIFIHSHAIDIRFRRDEKRFDVEGAYNIRYHIIKKRIDKVHLRNSSERLTQPGKIALVYFNQKEADEYVSYIHYLQGQGVLADDLETLDLEELQGVAGLKALRVGVNLDVPEADEPVEKKIRIPASLLLPLEDQ
ncbi:MAG: GAF domain-containing protein [Chitinophagaceae bacterium]|nr:MAG: GAF domain-containing protein [Chitinophagaceae bacterium]